MNRLNQTSSVSSNDEAIKNLIAKTEGIDYSKNFISLTGSGGGKLSGQTNALSWDAQGNVNFASNVVLGDKPLYLRSAHDTYHGVKFDNKIDGPRLWGNRGGALGYGGEGGGNVMTWNNNNANLMGNVTAKGTIDAAGFTINGKPIGKNPKCRDITTP